MQATIAIPAPINAPRTNFQTPLGCLGGSGLNFGPPNGNGLGSFLCSTWFTQFGLQTSRYTAHRARYTGAPLATKNTIRQNSGTNRTRLLVKDSREPHQVLDCEDAVAESNIACRFHSPNLAIRLHLSSGLYFAASIVCFRMGTRAGGQKPGLFVFQVESRRPSFTHRHESTD